MLFQIKTINGQKTIVPLTADTGAGAPVGSLIAMYKKSSPSGYLYCDGSTFDETKYPALYQYLGSNVLPDYREFALVGAEENTTDVYNASTNPTGTIHDHDVYTEGQAKDDQLQTHQHGLVITQPSGDTTVGIQWTTTPTGVFGGSITIPSTGRNGTVTRGKRKAVYFYIKATSGLTENQQENVLNTINENLSYSTTEHATGKKWIDGKPIYRKVINVNSNPATIQTGLTSANEVIDVRIKNTVSGTSDSFTFNGCLNDTNIYYPWLYELSPDNATLSRITGTYSGTVKFVILEYTKTNE